MDPRYKYSDRYALSTRPRGALGGLLILLAGASLLGVLALLGPHAGNAPALSDPLPRNSSAGQVRMSVPRMSNSATVLKDGRVLVVGGMYYTGDSTTQVRHWLDSAELYDPQVGSFSRTTPLRSARAEHTATLLPDGRVLIAGGEQGHDNVLSTAERFDPVSGKFTATGRMATERTYACAARLLDGRVLIAGGFNYTDWALAGAELYDPTSGTFSPTGSMATAREDEACVTLADGRVLVVGGYAPSAELGGDTFSSAEIYDPASGAFTQTGSMLAARMMASATLLPDGRVLIVGGQAGGDLLDSAELFDPATGSFRAAGTMACGRGGESIAALLPSGRVLIAGGSTVSCPVESYDPASGTFVGVGRLDTPRAANVTVALPDGRVLVVGGSDGSRQLDSGEILVP